MSSIGCKHLLLAALAASACGGSGKADGAEEPSEGDAPGKKWEGPSSGTDDEEEDEDDGLQVKGLRGRLEPQQIEAGLSPHQASMSSCYNTELKQKRFLGGKLQLKVLVGIDGQVTTAQVTESNLGAWPVEKCLLDIAREMMFAPPKGGNQKADFTVPLDFASGSASIDFWEEERITPTVTPKLPELDRCAQTTATKLPRNVTVTLYIGNKGEVKSVGFASPSRTPIDDEWATCAAGVVSLWVMPDPLGVVTKASFRYRPR